MCDTLTNLVRRKEWVSCLVLICFNFLCIRSSALPARPLPVVSGKPHWAITYTCLRIQSAMQVLTDYIKIALRRDSVGSSGKSLSLSNTFVALDHAISKPLTLLNVFLFNEFDMVAPISIYC